MRSVPCILSVGQCSAGDYRLARYLRAHAGGHAIDTAATADEALAKIAQHSYTLILVNRVLDGDGASGVDLISRALAAAPSSAKTSTGTFMLISDCAEAQARAAAAGAHLGFGKSDLDSDQVRQAVRRALNLSPD